MRKLIVVGVFAACAAGVGGTALANYFYPGRVIIGTGIISGGTTTGTLGQDAQKMGEEPGCTVTPIECECWPGMPVWQACLKGGADMQCLTLETKYDAIKQDGIVVKADPSMTIGGLVCAGQSDGTAYVNLP